MQQNSTSYSREELRVLEENDDFKTIEVDRDGNCFYRVLAILMNRKESHYNEIKEEMTNYLLDNKTEFDELKLTEEMTNDVVREGVYASAEIMKLACFTYQRPIHVYLQSIEGKREVFDNVEEPFNKEPLSIVYKGEWKKGHY